MMRYLPARHYLSFGVVAFALAAFSGWLGLGWAPGFIPCVLFLLSGAADIEPVNRSRAPRQMMRGDLDGGPVGHIDKGRAPEEEQHAKNKTRGPTQTPTPG